MDNIVISEADKAVLKAVENLKKEYKGFVDAKEMLKEISEGLDDLEKKVDAYEKSYDKWKKDVNDNVGKYDNEIINNDAHEIAVMEEKESPNKNDINLKQKL